MTSQFSLKDRVALVTGGSRGVGLAFAQGLAAAGASIANFDIIPPSDAFLAIASEHGVKTASYTVNISSVASLEEGMKAFVSDFGGRLDICIACAGVNLHCSFLETPVDKFDDVFGVNVRGVYFTAQAAAKQMIANGTTCGSIVLVASIASWMAIRSQECTAYSASKGAVRSMVPQIAKELVKHKIRINSISPGYVRTEMTAGFPHLLESWKDEIMNGAVAEPDDIKGACVFLASGASSYMTGQDLLVDGGVTKW